MDDDTSYTGGYSDGGIMYVPSDPDAIVIREERKLTISSDFELYGIGTVVAPLKAENQKEQR